MRKTIWIAIAGLVLALLPAAPAGAAFECLETNANPDTDGPILYDFAMRPVAVDPPNTIFDVFDVFDLDPTEVGTRVEITADDRTHTPGELNFPNLVVRVLLEIDTADADPDNDIVEEMKPVDGRFGSIIEPVFHVLEPLELQPGVHEVTFTSQDSCGNEDTHTERVFHAPPVTATCDRPADTVCAL